MTDTNPRPGLQEALEKAVAAMARLDEKLAAGEGEKAHDPRYLLALLECALGEYADLGFVIVPREPTEEMVEAVFNLPGSQEEACGWAPPYPEDCWRVMIEAFAAECER